jgi:hypothetical protein
MQMRRGKADGSIFLAVLFVILMAGCNCDPFNPRPVTPSNAAGPPTVISTNPVKGATCVKNNTISALFSKAMDPATLTTSTFKVTGPALTPIPGAVGYAASSHTATFTPTSNLPVTTTFTGTITNGAKDSGGRALVQDYVWTFTTCATVGQVPVNLRTATNFVILARSTVTNVVSVGTVVTGDLGLSPGSAVTGFPPGVLIGTQHVADPTAAQAKLDLTTAFNDAAGRLGATIVASGELGGLTLAPGVYQSGISSFAITSVDLTLDGGGNANSVWVFQMPSSTLTVGNGRKVILAGGAKASNIFWQVGSSATLGTTSVVQGTILADQSITLNTGATLIGRALARIAAVSLDSSTVTKPAP